MGKRVGELDDIRAIMNSNEDFNDYVKSYCRQTGKTIEQALRDKIVQEVAKSYSKE